MLGPFQYWIYWALNIQRQRNGADIFEKKEKKMLQSTKPLLSQWPLPQSNSGSEQGKPQSRAQRATPAELPGPALPGHLVIQQKLGLPWTTLSTKVLLLFSPLGLHTLL